MLSINFSIISAYLAEVLNSHEVQLWRELLRDLRRIGGPTACPFVCPLGLSLTLSMGPPFSDAAIAAVIDWTLRIPACAHAWMFPKGLPLLALLEPRTVREIGRWRAARVVGARRLLVRIKVEGENCEGIAERKRTAAAFVY